MNNFDKKIDRFIEFFIEYEGYKTVLEGLQNTLKIAICGLLIGIVIGTLIAIVRVLPKYKLLPRVLNGICSFYVAFFRGTPMVVQLLLSYYVALPLMGINIPSVTVALFVFWS
jgi:polar amino acid transport system permease protein